MASEPIANEFEGEEPVSAPPFSFGSLALAVFAATYAGGGFGVKFVTELAFLAVTLWILIDSNKWMRIGIGLLIGACFIQPALIQSPALLGTLLLCARKPFHAALVLLGSSLQLVGALNPFFIPLFLIPVLAVAAKRNPALNGGWGIACALLLLSLNLIPTYLVNKSPQAHQGFAYAYRIDLGKMAGFSPSGSTYSSIDDSGDLERAELRVLEHDPKHNLADHNWSQNRLWIENQYFGSPVLRIATALDGFLYSNLGCRVDRPSLRLLGEAHRTEFNSFISRDQGRLVFSDSDFLTNGAIGYQKHLIDALFRRFSFAHAILYATAVCFVLGCWPRTRRQALILLVLASWLICLGLYYQKVDIRIVGGRGIWPHSKGVDGLASEADSIVTVGRTGRAAVLGVERDAFAKHRDEKVVVMEGRSKVKIGGAIFEALDLPLGEKDGIVDAVPVRRQGDSAVGACVQNWQGVVIIGTNSARKNWKVIHEAAN